jgi:putative tricarboxylic transport membrane protein
MKTPDFLAISVIGMFFVAFVSGSDALKGLGALLLGALVSFVGLDANMGAERFTGGMIYLWDGIPLSILFLGVFGLPELAALLDRKSIAEFGETGSGPTLMDGVRDTLREWKLVLQCSSIGAVVGAVPGVGVTVIDWIAYGVAKRDRRGGPEFGQGNIRGVIAPESANNAKEGGYLIPTLALGLPGSVTMTILLGAFTVQGLLPGPGMLKENLSITYSMVISLTLANILGASICMLLSRGLARLTMLPATTIFSVALVFVMLGAFYTHAIAEDILCLGLAASLGIWMKAWNWSRAAFSLGFVLGPNVERYFFLSYQLNGMSWLTRPSIIAVGVIMVWMAVRRIRAFRQVRASDAEMTSPVPNIASFGLLGLGSVWAIASLWSEEFPTRIFPQIAAVLMILVSAVLIGREYLVWRRRKAAPAPDTTAVLHDHHPWAMIATGAKALGALAALAVLSFAFGHLPAAALFVGTVLTVRDRRLRLANVLVALGTALAIYAVFDALMSVPWPRPWLAGVLPGY